LRLNFLSLVLPQINPFSFGDDEMNLDDAVTAVCTITKGDLPIRIWWTLVDDFHQVEKNLSTNDGLMISRSSPKISMLAIDAVKARHRGNYTCHAHNKAGVAHHSAFLHINGSKNTFLTISSLNQLILKILQFVSLFKD
jgi:Immunoglobulin domain